MSRREPLRITVHTDRPCTACGRDGATDSGVCLECIGKRLGARRSSRGEEKGKKMSKTYEVVDRETDALIAKVLRTHHEELHREGVTIGGLFVTHEDKHGMPQPAIKNRGYPIAAQIQITSLSDRVRGLADAKLTIDHFFWDKLPEASKLALIDHEVTHLILAMDDDGPKRDDFGRPMLKIRPHDWELTGFVDVVERHGEAAVEMRSLRAFRHEQLSLFCPDGLG
jgi:hypothetical protein